MMETDGFDDTTGRETIGEQCVVGMMHMKPCHDFLSLWMEDELATLQSDCRVSRHTSAFHHLSNVIQ